MSTHTSGPWKVRESKSGFPSEIVTVEKNPYGSETFVAHAFGPLSNARLIAAAPELFAALKRIVEYDDECDCGFMIEGDSDHSQHCKETEMILAGRAAIRKAEGK